MLRIDHDRRGEERVSLVRPCKVFNQKSGKYTAGTTCDVAAGGLLVRLGSQLNAEVGDRLFVGVAQKRKQALLRSREMIESEVVRRLPSEGGETLLALRYCRPSQGSVGQLNRAA